MIRADRLCVRYGRTTAVHDVTLELPAEPGGVALIGESGSGKTTIARALLGLVKPSQGQVTFRGQDIFRLDRSARAAYRSAVQPVFQDGSEALDPRMRVGASIAEALRLRRRTAAKTGKAGKAPSTVNELLADVGLDAELAGRRPHELSGGQRQRVIIARALAAGPTTLVLDEPTSALDVTVQARILDLLVKLRAERGLGYLLITHDLAIVDRLCDTMHVLFDGRIVESGPVATVLRAPAHPYTTALREAVPRLGKPAVHTDLTDARPAGAGCPYQHRCAMAIDRCATEFPAPRALTTTHTVSCHRAEVPSTTS